MKLELKHVAPYLPYGVKMTRNGFICELLQIELPKTEELANYFEFKVSCSDWWENLEDKNHYKPLLRPLSDLTKEIEVNGEKFVPIEKLTNEYLNTSYWGVNEIGVGVLDEDGNMKDLCFISNEICGECPYLIFDSLIKWHFDVFGLIEQGLAVDLNTI